MATLAPATRAWQGTAIRHWPIVVGLAAILVPTLIRLAQENWTTEAGVQGPIILATGLWLFYMQRDAIAQLRRPGSFAVFLALLVPLGLIYVVGRAFGFLVLEVAAAIAIAQAFFYLATGPAVAKRLWFALLYLYVVAPIPGWVQDSLTGTLKEWVSASVTSVLSSLGIPVIREGVVLYVAQYQLLVEDACAGLNSLTSLLAIGLFYVYVLHQATARYALLLSLTILPIAIFANMVRVAILVLLTYFVSDAAAQGFLHNTAGMVMFITALLTIMAIDSVASKVFLRQEARA